MCFVYIITIINTENENLQSETNTESVVLPDGTVISVADYKRLQQQKKLQQQVARER